MWLILNIFLILNFSPDPLGEMIGKNFLDYLSAKDWEKASLLLADTVNFDGENIKGHQQVTSKLKILLNSYKSNITFSKIYFFTGKEALLKFGRLPKRLSSVDLDNSIVVLARRMQGGIVIILNEIDKIKGRWRIVAITD